MSAFLSVDLLTDFAAFCLTDFIDWRYTHSWIVFSTQLVNCCPPPMDAEELYLCIVLHSVSDQIWNLLNCFTDPNKMTSEDDIKGLVSLTSFVHGEGYAKKDNHEPMLTRVKVSGNFDLLQYMTMDSKRCECEGVTRVLVLSCQNLKRRPDPRD